MRQTFCRFFSIFCLLSLPTSAHAQKPTAATALRDIQNTYNFDPSKLSFEEQAKRAPTLSALWDRYDKTSDVYRDTLRVFPSHKFAFMFGAIGASAPQPRVRHGWRLD